MRNPGIAKYRESQARKIVSAIRQEPVADTFLQRYEQVLLTVADLSEAITWRLGIGRRTRIEEQHLRAITTLIAEARAAGLRAFLFSAPDDKKERAMCEIESRVAILKHMINELIKKE